MSGEKFNFYSPLELFFLYLHTTKLHSDVESTNY
jgi:hypothetical protein